jgi:hypothetical protein
MDGYVEMVGAKSLIQTGAPHNIHHVGPYPGETQ